MLHPDTGKQSERRAKIVARCAAQARFCRASSPPSLLYHHILDHLGCRLLDDDDFAAWLLTAPCQRASFDIPLLFLAALHAQVLDHNPATRALAAYYPSAGGVQDAGGSAFVRVLAQAVDFLRDELAAFIASSPVQTNEGARGLCWLLPLAYTGWNTVHLVELGASAGLNLVAEQRCYVLTNTDDTCGHGKYFFGMGQDEAFKIQGEGCFVPPAMDSAVQVLSRYGCDLSPVQLQTEAEMRHLAAFVWADQPARMRMLLQGIKAVWRNNLVSAPVHLQTCRLAEELPVFLRGVKKALAPTVLYNTYLGAYLPDKGQALQAPLALWAQQQPWPVLWLQWEHLHGKRPPEFGWLGWKADLWQNGAYRSWHLAWVHPHGSRVFWLPGLKDWSDFWRAER